MTAAESSSPAGPGSGRLRRLASLALWAALFAWASSLLLDASRHVLERGYPEDDYYLALPITAEKTHGKGLSGGLAFTFHLRDEYPVPSANGYFWLLQRLFGLDLHRHVLFGIALHHLNAALFFLLLYRGLRTGALLSGFGAVFYLTFYPQFHAYLWPFAAQHLLVQTGAFLTLWLYLETESQAEAGQVGLARWLRILAFAAGLFASFQRTPILIVPVHIAADIALRAADAEDRARRYRRWMPLLLLFIPFRALMLGLDAEGKGIFLHLPAAFDALPPWLRTALLTAAGCAAVVGACRLLTRLPEAASGLFRQHRERFTPLAAGIVGASAFAGLLYVSVPWILALKLALKPQADFGCLTLLHRTHVVSLPSVLVTGPSLFELAALACLCAALVWCAKRSPTRLPFAFWYLAAFAGAADKGPFLSSRYYVYIAPAVAVFLGTVLADVGGSLLRIGRSRLRRAVHALAVLAAAGALASSNTGAIRERLRITGLLPGTIPFYNDLRIASLVREDLHRRGEAASRQGVSIDGVEPAPFFMMNKGIIMPDWDDRRHHPLKYALGAMMGWSIDRAVETRVNEGPSGGLAYIAEGGSVKGADGAEIDPFYADYLSGIRAFGTGDDAVALQRLSAAVSSRPFLFRRFLERQDPPGRLFSQHHRTLPELWKETRWWISKRAMQTHTPLTETIDFVAAASICAYLHRVDGSGDLEEISLRQTEGLLYRWPMDTRRIRLYDPEVVDAIASRVEDPVRSEALRSYLRETLSREE